MADGLRIAECPTHQTMAPYVPVVHSSTKRPHSLFAHWMKTSFAHDDDEGDDDDDDADDDSDDDDNDATNKVETKTLSFL